MIQPSVGYREQAAAALARAEAAVLPSVKAREMVAFDAWTRLAERAELTEVGREGRQTK